MQTLVVQCPSFGDNEWMPKKHTGFDADQSPEFNLIGLDAAGVSIAIVMDDLDVPFVPAFNHWLIWNIPCTSVIPGGIPSGESVPDLSNATQGVAYGNHCYRGPKQPVFIRNTHRYRFQFYVLNSFLQLDADSRRPALLSTMEGHILQQAQLTGKYKR